MVPKSVKEISASENPTAQKPVLILLAGTAGAGRTSFYESQLRTVFPVLLKASASPIEQAETDRERSRLTKEGHSFVYQNTTIDSQMIREALEAGFDFKVFYVGTEDPNLNMGRVLLRVSNGGPFAALARIHDDYVHALKHLPEAKKLADDLMLFDNTTHGRGHRLVAHFHAGELMKLARAVRDAMPAFFDLLREETHPAVRVVLGHFLFVYIHPYMDGNGRVGRFLMNTMMAPGGYPWTTIPVSDRNAYVNALEKASVGEDIVPFADLLAGLVKKGLAGESLLQVPKSS